MPWLLSGAALLGLLLGSFADVVAARVPADRSIVRPRSACEGCAATLGPADLVPVVSWLAQGGRCRRCGRAIGLRPLALELVMAAVFVLVTWRVGPAASLPAHLLWAWLLVTVSAIDLDVRRIPNRLTYPLAPTLAVLFLAAGVVAGAPGDGVRALLGGAVGFGLLLALALIQPAGMGMGDVKLAGIIGLGLGALGWAEVVVGLLAGFVVGGVVAVGLLVSGRRTRRDAIPFGPSLAAGALIGLVAGGAIADGYLRAAGLG